MKFLQEIGSKVIGYFRNIGVVSIFFYKIFKYIFTSRWYFSVIWQQLIKIGFLSLPVVGMTAIFTGGALALQIFVGASRYSIAIYCF